MESLGPPRPPPPPGRGGGAGALRRRRRRPAALPPELSVYSPPSLSLDGAPVAAPPPPLPPLVDDESTSLQLDESTSLLIRDPSVEVELQEESTSLVVPLAPPQPSVAAEPSVAPEPPEEATEPVVAPPGSLTEEPTLRPAAPPEATVDEETEMVARGDVLPSVLRLGDLRLPELVPMALPTRVLPGDWPIERQDSTPSQGVSAAVADDVQAGPPAEELELLPDAEPPGDDLDLGDELEVDDEIELEVDDEFELEVDDEVELEADAEDDLEVDAAVDDLASLVEEAHLEQVEHAERSVDLPGPARSMRGEPLPQVDSVDEELPIELHDGGPIAGPEAWGADELPTQVEPAEHLAQALALLQEAESAPLTLGVVDGAAPPSPEDLADDGLSLDLDTESVELESSDLLSLDVLLDATDEPSADPDVLQDLDAAPSAVRVHEDDLSRLPPSAVWLELGPAAAAPQHALGGAFLELLDPADHLELARTAPAAAVVVTPPTTPPTTPAAPPTTPAAPPTTPAPRSVAPPDDFDEVELEEEPLPPLDDRPPEELAAPGEDSVDELLILEEEDSGPASLTLDVVEKDDAADLLAEGGAIRVDLGLGDKPAASPEEARKGVAVAPARPLRRWDGKSGENTERTTDLVALARLQQNSGAAARPIAAPPAEEPSVDDDGPRDDDWLADLPEDEPAAAAPGVVVDKGDPMSPYYEDTMPGWLPGDDAAATRGAPRPADITAAGRAERPAKAPSGKKKKT